MDKEQAILLALADQHEKGAHDIIGLTKSFLEQPQQPWEKVELLYNYLPSYLRPLFYEAYKGELDGIRGYKALVHQEEL